MKVSVQCDCGAVQGQVESRHLKGYRAVCLCDDCQAFAHALKRADTLDGNGGTDIIPVMPAHYVFEKGVEKIKCLRLVPEGMFRWYASCCNTPLGNTMNSPSMPYIGVPARIFTQSNSSGKIEQEFGPVRERMQAQFAKGPLPPLAQKTVSIPFMLRVIRFIAFSKATGRGKPSPFFIDGKPLAEPQVLTTAEREALRPLTGPKREMK